MLIIERRLYAKALITKRAENNCKYYSPGKSKGGVMYWFG